MKAAIEKLIDALKQIEQYSDPGDPMTAVIEMKSIASDALNCIDDDAECNCLACQIGDPEACLLEE